MAVRGFFRNDLGTGAIEFAFIAASLCLIVLGVGSGWSYIRTQNNMRDGIEAAGKYYIQGGKSDTTAKNIVTAAWSNKPAGGTVNVVRCQICPGQTGCVVSLNCANASVPQIHVTVTVNGTWHDPFHSLFFGSSVNMTDSEVIRVR